MSKKADPALRAKLLQKQKGDAGAPPITAEPVAYKSKLPLSEDQQRAVDLALQGRNLFITGPGGTGKSVTVTEIIKALRCNSRHVAVTASTGIAAVRINGRTIHSYMGTGIYNSIPRLARAVEKKEVKSAWGKVKQRILDTHTLIVDEVSMLSGDYIRMMDWWLKRVTLSKHPFGGRQVIFTGDFLQLPPVIRPQDNVKYKYAFDAPPWKNLDMETVYLTKSFRQDEAEFVGHLMKIREGLVSPETIDYFADCVGRELTDPTRLFSTNATAAAVNERNLEKLPGVQHEYEASYDGDDRYFEKLVDCSMAEYLLCLKPGAPVLFTQNDRSQDKAFVNGTRGVVENLDENSIQVRTSDGRLLSVPEAKWEWRDADDHVLTTMYQYPLKLAWALTIHKSQGMTLECLECDLSDCFETGQAYVALSRAKTKEGLSLADPIDRLSVRADRRAVTFYRLLRDTVSQEAG